MTPDEINRLAEAARRAGVHELELNGPGMTLRLRLQRDAVAGPEPVPTMPDRLTTSHDVRAPGVGLVRHGHPLTGRPASEPGQRVAAGQIVGFLDVGPCLRPIISPEDGVIGEPLCDDGVLVGYGTLLYRLA